MERSEAPMDVVSAADELYGVPLASFVAGRTRLEKQARAAGERSLASKVRALRKPSQAAWALNQVVRRGPELLDDVLRLGDELRGAQEAGDTAAMRRLTARRHELVAALRRRAAELVAEDGRQLGAAAGQALERSVGAAMADPRAARVVRSGRLVTDLENAGWGAVDLDGAEAVATELPSAPSVPEGAVDETASTDKEPGRDAARRHEAERAWARAEEVAAGAAADLDRAEQALAAATAQRQRLSERREALLGELRALELHADQAVEDVRTARDATARSARESERAARLAARARDRFERLPGGR